jgi:NAD-dependent SIR2 family protein deacetylase
VDAEVSLRRAAGALSCATALFVVTGDAIGADGGLADPRLFGLRTLRDDMNLAWGWFARRRRAFRLAAPHAAISMAVRWSALMRDGAFALTTNADGALQRGRFRADRIVEARGSIEWLQCARNCGAAVFPGGIVDVDVDPETDRARGSLPGCPACGGLARPNVELAGDEMFDPSRAHEQEDRMNEWLADVRGKRGRKLVVVECGVGDAPTRARTERIVAAMAATLVRIDARGADVAREHVGLAMDARDAMERIEVELRRIL